jgi:glycosyltransferase involved in cell wall biosynthesis
VKTKNPHLSGPNRLAFLVKRHYSNQDLLKTGFGRYGQLSRRLKNLGLDVAVFLLDYAKGARAESLELNGVRFNSFPARPLAQPSPSLRSALRQFDPDTMIAGGHVDLATCARKAIGNDHPAHLVFDHYDYYPAFFPKAFRMIGSILWHRSLRHAHAFMAASPALASLLESRRPGVPVVVVRNGFDPAVFHPRDRSESRRKVLPGIHPGERIVGYFGGIAPYVALPEVLRILDRFETENGNPIHLLHAGPRVRENHSRYLSLGPLSQADVSDAMAACDVVLAPYRDGPQVRYSNACKLAEYAALELPVIASRNGDWAAAISPGYSGLYEPGNDNSLFRALRSQLTDPQPLPSRPELSWGAQCERLWKWLQNHTGVGEASDTSA